MDKRGLLIEITTKYVVASQQLSDEVYNYLTQDIPKIEVAKKVKKAQQRLEQLKDYIKDYVRD